MDMRTLKCFVWTAELGNITKASAELGIVQSALSRKIKGLEVELGSPLFARLPRGLQLTQQGQQFLGHAKRILREAESARNQLKQNQPFNGTVTLGLSPTVSAILAPGCLEQVANEFPGISLNIVEGFSSIMLERLISGRIDVAVLTNPPRMTDINLEPAVTEQVVVVTAKGVRGMQPFYTVDELCRTPLLLTSAFRKVVDDQLSKFGKKLAPSNEVDSIEAIRIMVLKGLAVTVMPVSTFQSDIRDGRMNAFHIIDANLFRLLVIASPQETRITSAMIKIVDILSSQFTALSDEGFFRLS